METQEKAQLESAVSMLIALHASLNKTTVDKGDHEKRSSFRDALLSVLSDYKPDKNGWDAMKTILPYDDYLVGRQVDGTVTPYDMIRPGLLRNQFASENAYYEHMARATKVDPRVGDVGPVTLKLCSQCNTEKPITKFRHRGGAVCHSCRGKKYRENKAEVRADER